MRVRAFILIASFILAGVFISFLPKPGAPRKSEAWLESQAPKSLPGYSIMPYTEDPQNPRPASDTAPNISYRMDQKTYETLKPFGIICQVFRGQGQAFDAVIITSDSHQSFHDASVCFQSQGWALKDQKRDSIVTKSHGRIPVTVIEVENSQGTNLALLTYSGPKGFRRAPLQLFRDMFFNQLRTGKVSVCHFYRFIALHPGATKDELKRFAATYIDAANKSSNGYF